MYQAAPVATAPVAAAPVVTNVAPVTTENNENSNENSRYITVKSPMIGTFYRTPGPDKDAFVNVGDTIQKGDKVCIIEAMKTFNEIEAEISGKIIKVLVDNASPVDYDQPLFLVDPA
jgi:acetyl-CoA carboxylase biotin carboxyl carrier protein